MQADLSGKVALITGSTKGIGRDIAVLFAENGADIALNARSEGPASEVIRQIEALGRRAIFEPADIFEYARVKRMVDNVLQQMGRIDILVVSGGATEKIAPNFFRELDPESYLDFAKSQWISRLYCIRAVLDHLIERRTGKIVLLGTDAGRWPTPGESMPGGAGAALVMSTKVLAQEFARWQIRINTLSTTVTRDTPGLDMVLSASPASKVFRKALERQPFPLMSADVAQATLFLASSASDAITGQTLSVNGGLCFPG